MNHKKLYEDYKLTVQKVADTRYAAAVLQWDQETYMPQKGAAARSRQLAALTEIAHELFTAPVFRTLLDSLQDCPELDQKQQANVSLSRYDLAQQEKLSGDFVRRLSETSSRSFHSWVAARKQNDFGIFAPDLEALLALKRQESDLLGYEEHPYNAQLNQYERGASVRQLDALFSSLQAPLKDLLDQVAARPPIQRDFLKAHYPRQQQWEFGMAMLKDLGFDFEAGRQDISEHPFTINFSAGDVRITTRIDENDCSNMIWSCIHECGHALYEQGLPEEQYGLPLGEYCSLSIHESQSRLWENNLGRGIDAWHYFYPRLQQYFPRQLKDTSLQDFYRAINIVQPSLIRTEADELTYHFHVMIRYELEKQLLAGTLPVREIPAYWKEAYRQWLGVEVPDDRQGCLQDVHWSHGSFGYFPTYSLGSLYAAQFFHAATEGVNNLGAEIRKGDFKPLLDWLRINIHQYGRRFPSESLCQMVSGQPLNIQHFINYARNKYQGIYNL